MTSKKAKSFVWTAVFVFAIIICVAVFLNREWIYDWWRGMSYQVTDRMANLRSELQLTDRGAFLFNASQPALNMRDDFNQHCRGGGDDEIAVLGCYVSGNIYVYDINAEELEGIKELTLAHELLHAVWARMGESERVSLNDGLAQVLKSNEATLGEELATYGEKERQEELYVRAGTEIKNLPAELEKHYAEIFKNQDAVVEFYEKYIRVFRETKRQITEIKEQMEVTRKEYDALGAEYSQRLEQYNADVMSFNRCVETRGCFESIASYETRRGELVSERNNLSEMYTRLDGLVGEYNALVDRYNENVLYEQKLNDMINSNSKVAE